MLLTKRAQFGHFSAQMAQTTGKRINRVGEGAIAKSVSEETKSKRQGRGIVRAGYGNKKGRKATTKGHKNKVDF